jgi:hypothetical protein
MHIYILMHIYTHIITIYIIFYTKLKLYKTNIYEDI